MSQITIGKSGSRNIHIDIDALLRGRMHGDGEISRDELAEKSGYAPCAQC